MNDINAVIARVLAVDACICPACMHPTNLHKTWGCTADRPGGGYVTCTCSVTQNQITDPPALAEALHDALKREEEAKEDIADLLTEARWANWADYPKGTYRKADEMREIYERWFGPTPTANEEAL